MQPRTRFRKKAIRLSLEHQQPLHFGAQVLAPGALVIQKRLALRALWLFQSLKKNFFSLVVGSVHGYVSRKKTLGLPAEMGR